MLQIFAYYGITTLQNLSCDLGSIAIFSSFRLVLRNKLLRNDSKLFVAEFRVFLLEYIHLLTVLLGYIN